MAGILLNLLAVTTGGQVTRADAFLRRFRHYNSHERLVVLKNRQSLQFFDDRADLDIRNISFGNTKLKALVRMIWENLFVSRMMRQEKLDRYLTFSHFLPFRLGPDVRSIVGVSNLAPFSDAAWSVESKAVRVKMFLLRRSLVSSALRADRVIALSNECERILVAHGVRRSCISVVPNGVDVCQSDDIGFAALPSVAPYILSVSHFHRYKNYERLVDAYRLLPDGLRQKFHLIIVGKPDDPGYYDAIYGRVKHYGLQGRVRLIPGVDRDQLQALYRNAALFVFPSLIENCPNILLESMACGLPIVTSAIAPMPEFGSDAVWYFNGLSATDLADRMAELLTNGDIAAELGCRAKARAQMYSWDRFAKKVMDICGEPSLRPRF